MSSERIKGEIVFTCDVCDDTLETGESGFPDANQLRVDEGWSAFTNDRGDWEHRCKTCRRSR